MAIYTLCLNNFIYKFHFTQQCCDLLMQIHFYIVTKYQLFTALIIGIISIFRLGRSTMKYLTNESILECIVAVMFLYCSVLSSTHIYCLCLIANGILKFFKVCKLVIQHQQSPFPIYSSSLFSSLFHSHSSCASFWIHATTWKTMKHGRHLLEVLAAP